MRTLIKQAFFKPGTQPVVSAEQPYWSKPQATKSLYRFKHLPIDVAWACCLLLDVGNFQDKLCLQQWVYTTKHSGISPLWLAMFLQSFFPILVPSSDEFQDQQLAKVRCRPWSLLSIVKIDIALVHSCSWARNHQCRVQTDSTAVVCLWSMHYHLLSFLMSVWKL